MIKHLGDVVASYREVRLRRKIHGLVMDGHAHIQRKQFDEGRARMLQALTFRDSIADPAYIAFILTSLGSTWLSQERFAAAVEFFTEYTSVHPGDAEAFSERAAALWYSGQQENAVQDYSRALNLSSMNVGALLGRGQVLVELGRIEQAEHDLELMFRQLDSISTTQEWKEWRQSVEAYGRNGRAAILASKRRFEEAEKEFERSVALAPENGWVYFNRAQARELRGDLNKAVLDYRQSLEKTDPRLCPWKRKHAEQRLRELKANS